MARGKLKVLNAGICIFRRKSTRESVKEYGEFVSGKDAGCSGRLSSISLNSRIIMVCEKHSNDLAVCRVILQNRSNPLSWRV